MSSLILTIFSLAVIFTIGCALVVDKRFLRVERFLFSLIFASTIFTSLAPYFKGESMPSLVPEGTVEGERVFDTVMTEAMERGLCEALIEEFSLKTEDFSLTLSKVDTKTHLPTRADVVLRNKGIFTDVRAMEAYLKEKGGFSDVSVSVQLGA